MPDLYLEPFAGVSGDMLNAALLDVGGDQVALQAELAKLNLPEFKLEVTKKTSSSIAGTDFNVVLLNGVSKDAGTDYSHLHDHHNISHPHHHPEVRNLAKIVAIIEKSELSQFVKTHSIAVFKRIAKAEASVHNMALDEIHFHEVGATDSIVDIVSFFVLYEQLKIKNVYSAPIVDGTGTIKVAHGVMPVPVPAVMALRKNCQFVFEQDLTVKTELVTPTGLAILQDLKPQFKLPHNITLTKTGYGFGKRDTGRLNALRVSLGTQKHSQDVIIANDDEICKLEVNVDDQTPEQIGFAMETLIDAGALDVYFTPIQMKKNRPAVLITVLCEAKDYRKFCELLFKHTATIGVRYTKFRRLKMTRTFEKVLTPLGVVHVKRACYHDITKATVEYDDCVRLAEINDLPLAEVMKKVNQYLKNN